jgi:hypothetical protein
MYNHLGAYQAFTGTDPGVCGDADIEPMHLPEETQLGVLGNGGQYQPGTGTGRGVNKKYEATVNGTSNQQKGDAAGGLAALAGNGMNCYMNAQPK